MEEANAKREESISEEDQQLDTEGVSLFGLKKGFLLRGRAG